MTIQQFYARVVTDRKVMRIFRWHLRLLTCWHVYRSYHHNIFRHIEDYNVLTISTLSSSFVTFTSVISIAFHALVRITIT